MFIIAKENLGDITNQIYTLLSELEAETKTKILRAVCDLLDVADVTGNDGGPGPDAGAGKHKPPANDLLGEPKQVFANKNPNTKAEIFSVGASIIGDSTPITKDDLKAIIIGAKRSFDDSNFGRDMDAAIKAGFFIKSGGRGQYALSHYGESYVTALPDRVAAKQIKRPKRAGVKAKRKAK